MNFMKSMVNFTILAILIIYLMHISILNKILEFMNCPPESYKQIFSIKILSYNYLKIIILRLSNDFNLNINMINLI
jgi:hypothetical protein